MAQYIRAKDHINKALDLTSRIVGRVREQGWCISFNSGYELKLDKFRFNSDTVKNLLTKRMVMEWNRLGSHVVNANMIGTFKKE